MKRFILIILASAILIPAFGQRNRNEDEEEVIPVFKEGITYALPRTGLKVYIQAVKESFVPGPYVAYAEQLLGITSAKTRAEEKWSIEGIRIETFSEPDPEQVYKAMGYASYLVNLAPNGCIAGINSDNTVIEMQQVKTNSFVPEIQYNDGFSFANFNDSPIYVQGDSTNNFRPVRVSNDQKAAEAAARILDSRLTQYDMVAGMFDEFHPDGEAYQVSLEELKVIEKEYLSLFTGRTTYSHQTFSFDFVPSASSARGEIAFRFSEENGVVPASDLSGNPVMIQVEPVGNLVEKYSSLATSDNSDAGVSGVYYRMPGIANVNVIYELNTIASVRAIIAQTGRIAPLPEELLLGNYAIDFHPETGAIESVRLK